MKLEDIPKMKELGFSNRNCLWCDDYEAYNTKVLGLVCCSVECYAKWKADREKTEAYMLRKMREFEEEYDVKI